MTRQFDKYCQDQYQEWLESEAEADRQDLLEEQEAAKADEEYESRRLPMTSGQADERFMCDTCKKHGPGSCAFDCVLSSTCSFKCKTFGMSNYFQGDLDDAPAEFGCVHCGVEIKNKFKRR